MADEIYQGKIEVNDAGELAFLADNVKGRSRKGKALVLKGTVAIGLDAGHEGLKATALIGVTRGDRGVTAIAVAADKDSGYPSAPAGSVVAAPRQREAPPSRPVQQGYHNQRQSSRNGPGSGHRSRVDQRATNCQDFTKPTAHGPMFANSYNFVPPTERTAATTGMERLLSIGHSRYAEGLYSGTIAITIETRTPLLLPDHDNVVKCPVIEGGGGPKDLRVYSMRKDAAGKPLLDGSAIKGMLRSAFEAVTGSRMGVFFDHDDPLSTRADIRTALELRPARVVKRRDGTCALEVITSFLHPDAQNVPDPHPAVWVPKNLGDVLAGDGDNIQRAQRLHGREVIAKIFLLKHDKRGRQPEFAFWRVAAVAEDSEEAEHTMEAAFKDAPPYLGETIHDSYELAPIFVHGVLHWNGGKFGTKKHDERLFVIDVIGNPANSLNSVSIPLTSQSVDGRSLTDLWRAVIDGYGEAHIHENPLDRDLGLHISDAEGWRELTCGRTLYVELDNGDVVKRMSPTLVGRDVYSTTPLEMAKPHHLGPARTVDQMSDADWVFGWAAPERGDDKGVPGHRGHLRIDAPHVTKMHKKDAIRHNVDVPLATLNSPKPAQFLFYTADDHGQPRHRQGRSVDNSFRSTDTLRGWKTYQYERLLADSAAVEQYWSPPKLLGRGATNEIDHQCVTVNGEQRYREYLAPSGYKVNVSVGISEWIRPKTVFATTIRVDNLTKQQLGALLWLLTLPDAAMHRLGWAKPLGFGVVRISADLDRAIIRTGEQIKARTLNLAGSDDRLGVASLTAITAAYTEDSTTDGARQAFLAIAKGVDGLPVHAPRSDEKPQTKSYEWWVANDRQRANQPSGQRFALPLAAERDQGLPYNPTE